jgi:hypothetical protein
MDPQAALNYARKAASGVLDDMDHERATDPDDVQRLAESFQALDHWLSRGGFLPSDWKGEADAPVVTFDQALITEARGLRSEHGENPEYDRALVELVIRLTPGASHDEHTEVVRGLIGVTA